MCVATGMPSIVPCAGGFVSQDQWDGSSVEALAGFFSEDKVTVTTFDAFKEQVSQSIDSQKGRIDQLSSILEEAGANYDTCSGMTNRLQETMGLIIESQTGILARIDTLESEFKGVIPEVGMNGAPTEILARLDQLEARVLGITAGLRTNGQYMDEMRGRVDALETRGPSVEYVSTITEIRESLGANQRRLREVKALIQGLAGVVEGMQEGSQGSSSIPSPTSTSRRGGSDEGDKNRQPVEYGDPLTKSDDEKTEGGGQNEDKKSESSGANEDLRGSGGDFSDSDGKPSESGGENEDQQGSDGDFSDSGGKKSESGGENEDQSESRDENAVNGMHQAEPGEDERRVSDESADETATNYSPLRDMHGSDDDMEGWGDGFHHVIAGENSVDSVSTISQDSHDGDFGQRAVE
jgi:hypothetical protein